LSPTERKLLSRFLSSLVTSIGFGLPADVPGRPIRVVEVHADARQLVGIDRKTTMVGLPITIGGDLNARLEVAMPSSWLVAPKSKGTPQKPKTERRRLGDQPDQIVVDVAAELGRARLSLRKLLNLAPGDLVLLSSSPRALVPVLVQGRPRLLARAEVKEGRVAMVIAAPPTPQKPTPSTNASTNASTSTSKSSRSSTSNPVDIVDHSIGDAHG
ncbi:MAG TPA: FliM/FliN family flagellar motor switch protein, partial [Myxococcota bacterium]